MRNLKKFLALVLATMMLLSVAVISTSAASTDADYTEAAQRLAALQVMKGNENGDLMLDNGVTRYQAALFFVQALTGETETATWNSTKNSAYFGDVVEYGTAIDYAYGIGLILGRGNGVYGYNDAITYQDMLVMAVRALGYETADMSYPYGYILAAQKLGLTENVELVDYKAALTRGETAQIIWDMLDTQVAVVDPITDKILYPDEKGLTDTLLSQNGQPVTERETLMESSDLAGDKIEVVVTDFDEADEDDEDDVDTVTLTFSYVDEKEVQHDETIEIAAADLGITVDTPAVSYKGLPYEVYIDVDVEDFDKDAYDDGDANVVFAYKPTYTDVLNLGDGNVKVVKNADDDDKSYISLGGTKYTEGKYSAEIYSFIDGEWTKLTKAQIAPILADFTYDSKSDDNGGYPVGASTFASVSYRETDRTYPNTEDTTDVEKTIVEILYTPLTFGQYNVRELKDRANSSKETNFVTIATYDGLQSAKNYDGEKTYFKEVLLGTTSAVTENTTYVSAKNGELAKSVTVTGAAVEAGDFMFYAYNETDNILTVVKNCGTFQTGRLTAQTPSKKTVKINGTSYEFGFVGYADDTPSDWADYKDTIKSDYIALLEAGKDNVKYLLVDGNIVYMEQCDETTNNSVYDFAIITTDCTVMEELLDMTHTKYTNALAGVTETEAGVYVDDNGYMAVAMMNKTTGEWELASIKAVELDYDAKEDEFDTTADPATLASYVDMFSEPAKYSKYDNYKAAMAVIAEVVVAVVDENDGVYTIASSEYTDADDNDASFFVSGATTEGILFSDTNNKTNEITADDDVDEERVTLSDDTVIIVVDKNLAVGSRVGVQGADNSYKVAEGYFLAASSDLIVLVETTASTAADAVTVAQWKDEATSSSDKTWYVTTVDTGVELENVSDSDDAEYVVTITNVIDLKTFEVVDAISMEVDSATDALTKVDAAGNVLYLKGDKLTVAEDTVAKALLKAANNNDDKITYVSAVAENIVFKNADTITVAEITGDNKMAAGEAVDINVTVVTVNNVEDADDYDFDNVVINDEYPVDDEDAAEEDTWDVGSTTITLNGVDVDYWSYVIDGDMVEEINEPADGILDSYILAMDGAEILVPEVDADDYKTAITCTVDLEVVAAYEDGVVYLTVLKTINQVVAD